MLGSRYGWSAELLSGEAVEQAVARRVDERGGAGSDAYVRALACDAEECRKLAELMAVYESWFFRDAGAFEYLIHYVRERWVRGAKGPLRVLSVGCARGEEPYTVVMTLLEAGLKESGFVVEAVDMSGEAIEAARRGFYRDNAFRTREQGLRTKFFTAVEGGWLLDRRLAAMVKFVEGNVMDDEQQSLRGRYDVVFCRNLLIYLTEGVQELLVKKLGGLLADEGVMLVGPSEGGLMTKQGFAPVAYPRCYAFTRASPPPLGVAATARESIRDSGGLEPGSAEMADLLSRASALADRGDLAAAKECCEEYLEGHSGSGDAYFTLALVSHAMGDDAAAQELFGKTVYLDPSHYEALVYLALLAEGRGDADGAERYRRRAERVLQRRSE